MTLKEGYVKDFISGVAVKATPEEIEAVQVFSRIRVEDYGYPKTLIQTRPNGELKPARQTLRKNTQWILLFSATTATRKITLRLL